MAVETIQNKDLNQPQGQPAAIGGSQPKAPATQNFNPFAGAQQNKQKGTGFTNIGKIVQANQGNKLGSTVAGGVQNVAQQARQGVQQAGQQFQQQAQAGRLDSAENQARVQNVLTDPLKASDEDVSAFEQFRSGQYGGPTSLQNAERLQSQVTQAQQLGQAANTAGGRQSLLQRFAGGPQYSAGQQRLDNLLLGATGGRQIAQAARSAQGLGGQLQREEDAAAAQAGELSNRAKAFGENVYGQLLDRSQGYDTALGAKAESANKLADTVFGQIKAAVGRGQISAADAKSLGIDNDLTYGLDASQFLNRNDDYKANSSNVMNQTDVDRFKALNRLAGGGGANQQLAGLLTKYSNVDPANQFNLENAMSFNRSALQQAANSKQADILAQQQVAGDATARGEADLRYTLENINDYSRQHGIDKINEAYQRMVSNKSIYDQLAAQDADLSQQRLSTVNTGGVLGRNLDELLAQYNSGGPGGRGPGGRP